MPTRRLAAAVNVASSKENTVEFLLLDTRAKEETAKLEAELRAITDRSSIKWGLKFGTFQERSERLDAVLLLAGKDRVASGQLMVKCLELGFTSVRSVRRDGMSEDALIISSG